MFDTLLVIRKTSLYALQQFDIGLVAMCIPRSYERPDSSLVGQPIARRVELPKKEIEPANPPPQHYNPYYNPFYKAGDLTQRWVIGPSAVKPNLYSGRQSVVRGGHASTANRVKWPIEARIISCTSPNFRSIEFDGITRARISLWRRLNPTTIRKSILLTNI